MAEEQSGERTQPATEARKRRAREEGQAPLSRELVTLAGLGAGTLMLGVAGPELCHTLAARLAGSFSSLDAAPADALRGAATALLMIVIPLLAVAAFAGAGAVLLQTGGLFRTASLTPDLSRLSPMRGISRILSPDGAIETLKSLVKLAVLGWATWRAMVDLVPGAMGAANAPIEATAALISRGLLHLSLMVLAWQSVIAAADTAWVRYRFAHRLRMSPHDIQQEHKEAEGDPKYKARLRQLRHARARRRMMAAVPKATVVITNPTHYAVALSYDRGAQAAPRVVAKGMDEVAARIRAMATQHGVPLVANPPLARALHKVDIDREVPAEYFREVAEIIAYVWRLGGRKRS